jgi:hypothetical protein
MSPMRVLLEVLRLTPRDVIWKWQSNDGNDFFEYDKSMDALLYYNFVIKPPSSFVYVPNISKKTQPPIQGGR